MFIKILFSIIFLFLTGCTKPVLELKTEPLTGKEYCFYKCPLMPLKEDEMGELILKYFKSDNSRIKPRIKGILQIRQMERREYDMNPNERLILLIDGVPYSLDLLHSTKIPDEEVHYDNHLYTPSGRFISLGSVKEVTRRGLAFFLSQELLLKILNANEVYFRIQSSSDIDLSTAEKQTIVFKFDSKNLVSLQEFKSRCIIN